MSLLDYYFRIEDLKIDIRNRDRDTELVYELDIISKRLTKEIGFRFTGVMESFILKELS